jgi:glutamate synthase domain-containing protein 3
VVEGVGDHAGSFMTRGFMVSIGDALGWNFGSGSSGDARMVLYDRLGLAVRQMSPDVTIMNLADADANMIERVKALIREHRQLTGSPRARMILKHWQRHLRHFRLVTPKAQQPEAAPAM